MTDIYRTMKVKEPITVMYLIDTYLSPPGAPSKGGAETQLYLLASSVNPQKFRPIVVQLSQNLNYPLSSPNQETFEQCHFPTGRLYGLNGIRQIGRLISFAKQRKVDIIHTFFEKSEVMGWVVARLAKIPIWVTSRRDLGFKRKEIYDRLFGLTGRGCRRLVANCQAIKEEVIQHEKFPGQKVEVIYNGLDFFIYEKAYENAHLRMGLGIENGSPVIGMVANFNFEIKGHKYFLEAAKKVNEKFPNARFLLIGDGPLKQKYEEMAEELGVPKSVLFLGKRGDVPAVMSSFDVSVLASTSEGFSNVILESMAAGKPVVATNVGGSKEMVLDGITGYLVPPANSDALAEKILMLLRNPDDAGAMGAEGRRIIQERFTVGVMVKKYENLYRSLIGEYFSEVSVHSVRDIR